VISVAGSPTANVPVTFTMTSFWGLFRDCGDERTLPLSLNNGCSYIQGRIAVGGDAAAIGANRR